MRFPMLMLAAAIAALACEKGAPLSNSTANLNSAANLSPVQPRTEAATGAQTAALPSPSVTQVEAAGLAAPSVAQSSNAAGHGNDSQAIAKQATANQPGANQPGANQPGANQPSANQPSANQPSALPPPATGGEGDGEPMDDVDDEEVSATDKSGVDGVTNDEAADEVPAGPVDESEGADIELRE